jgi:hypothetical protein
MCERFNSRPVMLRLNRRDDMKTLPSGYFHKTLQADFLQPVSDLQRGIAKIGPTYSWIWVEVEDKSIRVLDVIVL